MPIEALWRGRKSRLARAGRDMRRVDLDMSYHDTLLSISSGWLHRPVREHPVDAKGDPHPLAGISGTPGFFVYRLQNSPLRMPRLVIPPRRQHLRADQFDEIAGLLGQVFALAHDHAVAA